MPACSLQQEFPSRLPLKWSTQSAPDRFVYAGDGLSAGAGLSAALVPPALLLLLHVSQLMKGFACICCACEEREHHHLKTLL